MKEITIGGVSYLPATALAKEFRYTTDYIGQLCRAKKVDAQLIGRSWYVNPLSLKAHKTARYSKVAPAKGSISEEDAVHDVSITKTRVEVEPEVVQRAAAPAPVLRASNHNFAKRVEWKPVKYEADEEDLLPRIKREMEPRKVKVDLAESTDITIKTAAKMTKMVAEDLPTVSLRGKLSVSSLDESFELEEDEISGTVPVPVTVEVAEIMPERSIKPQKAVFHNPLPSREAVVKQQMQRKAVKSLPVVSPFTPVSVLAVTEEDNSVGIIHITLATTSGVLVLILALIFFTESSVTASALSYEWGMHFSTQSLSALVSLFSN